MATLTKPSEPIAVGGAIRDFNFFTPLANVAHDPLNAEA